MRLFDVGVKQVRRERQRRAIPSERPFWVYAGIGDSCAVVDARPFRIQTRDTAKISLRFVELAQAPVCHFAEDERIHEIPP